jgi:hypothetical protein
LSVQKIYNKVISEVKKLNNNRQIRASGNKSKAMWDLKGGTRQTEKSNEYQNKCEQAKDTGSKKFSQHFQ